MHPVRAAGWSIRTEASSRFRAACNTPYDGSLLGTPLNAPVVGIAQSERGEASTVPAAGTDTVPTAGATPAPAEGASFVSTSERRDSESVRLADMHTRDQTG